MRKPSCLICGGELLLGLNDHGNYSWRCSRACSPLDTAVPSGRDIAAFENTTVVSGRVDYSRFTRPLSPKLIDGAKVYMPFILYHFIECGWGPC